MRWSEFSSKECVDLVNGEKIGSFSHADLSFDPHTGKIGSIFVPMKSSWLNKKKHAVEIQWKMVRKVGPEMVIVDSKTNQSR